MVERRGVPLGPVWLVLLATCLSGTASQAGSPPGDYPVQPVPFTDVTITDAFWAPRLETNRRVTVAYDFQKCELTGRLRNFEVAGGAAEGEFQGVFGFNDSDVFKVVEGASYSLQLHPDPELESFLDAQIANIAAAQEEDGYLYTVGTIGRMAEEPVCCVSEERWADLASGHELYNVGHMYEAAVAHHQATGKRTLLEVAIKSADLLCRVFGPGRNLGVPGHQEVEIGLVKLYRVTGEARYLELAQFFLDQRGRAEGHELYGAYNQDHVPVTQQSEAVGHAVRAAYMYSGMADVGALAGDGEYVAAIGRIWNDVVSRKLYLTGGIGARRQGESFGDAYELPNRTAYAETCAAIANALWNHRMFLLHGEGKYIDVLERVIYNGFLSGVSAGGDRFFYPNPLASDGEYKFNIREAATRRPWFDCSCCPTNVVRFMPSLGGYVYAQLADALYVNLFVQGGATVTLGGTRVRVRQETSYPWAGEVRIGVEPERPAEFAVNVRIPGWAQERPVPSDLYRYLSAQGEEPRLVVNGEVVPLNASKGFARIERRWQKGDVIELELPMRVRRVLSHEQVRANQGRVALERGPVVYCAEAVDNGGRVFNLVLPDDAELVSERRDDLLGGVSVIRGRALGLHPGPDGRSVETRERDFLAVPYYAWSHRGEGEMAVWLPRRVMLDFEVE